MWPQPTSAPASVLLALVAVTSGAAAGCAATSQDRRPGWSAEQSDSERRCGAGSAPACAQLGTLLVASDGGKDDFERGIVLLEVSCGQRVLPACATLARIYGLQKDKRARARGHDLAKRACASQSADACTVMGEVIRADDPVDARDASEAFRVGCQLGDARGCELYGLDLWKDDLGGDKAAAQEALGRACVGGRRSACHVLATARLDKPETRRDGVALLTDNCARGHAPSCASAAFLAAPVVSERPACALALPFAHRACQAKDRNACAVIDACALETAREDGTALERLRAACVGRTPLACLYWADRQSARTDHAAELDRIAKAYEAACKGGLPASTVACPRAAAVELGRAKDETEAEAPLSALRQACARSSGEACCALGDAYRDGKGVPADASKASTFQVKACDLGLDRCCRK